MLEAKDIMTENLVYVKTKSPVIDALRLFSKHNITGIPVIKNDMTLVGIISEMDILRLFRTFKDEKDRPVNDFMTQPAVHFEQEESLLDICDFLSKNPIRRVPVTSNDKIVGIVSRSDIVKCILKLWDKNIVPNIFIQENVAT